MHSCTGIFPNSDDGREKKKKEKKKTFILKLGLANNHPNEGCGGFMEGINRSMHCYR